MKTKKNAKVAEVAGTQAPANRAYVAQATVPTYKDGQEIGSKTVIFLLALIGAAAHVFEAPSKVNWKPALDRGGFTDAYDFANPNEEGRRYVCTHKASGQELRLYTAKHEAKRIALQAFAPVFAQGLVPVSAGKTETKTLLDS